MGAVGTESQAQKVALMSTFGEAGIGKIRQLIGPEIENRDRLLSLRLLCTVSMVQQGGISTVGAYRDGGGKTIRRPDSSRGGRIQDLAGGERHLTRGGRGLGGKRWENN